MPFVLCVDYTIVTKYGVIEKNETLIRILSSNSLNDVIITVLTLFCCQYSETSLQWSPPDKQYSFE